MLMKVLKLLKDIYTLFLIIYRVIDYIIIKEHLIVLINSVFDYREDLFGSIIFFSMDIFALLIKGIIKKII